MNAVFSAIGLVVVLVFSLLLILRNIWLFLNLLRILFQDLDRFRQLPSYERMLFCFWIWNTEKFLSTKVPREASVVAENAQSQKQKCPADRPGEV